MNILKRLTIGSLGAIALCATISTTAQASPAAEGPAPAAPVAQHLYVAAIDNIGAQTPDATISAQLGEARSYWVRESEGRIASFDQVGDVAHYDTEIATQDNQCGLNRDAAMTAEAQRQFPGVDFNADGNHLMIVLPPACLATPHLYGSVGSSLASGGRTIVIGGPFLPLGAINKLGVNFSLPHDYVQTCTAGSCEENMRYNGYSPLAFTLSAGAPDAARPALGWNLRHLLHIADADEATEVDSSRSVQLQPVGSGSGTRAAVVTDPTTDTRYVVEYRAGVGRDAQTLYALHAATEEYQYAPGVTVSRLESDGSETLLTRSAGDHVQTSFGTGESFGVGGVRIEVGALSAGAQVSITVGQPATGSGATAAPTTTASPAPSGTSLRHFGSHRSARIVGHHRVGQRLSARSTGWGAAPSRLTYQWYAGGRAVRGATGQSLLLRRSLHGQRITVRVTAHRPGYEPTTAASARTREIRPAHRG